MGRKKKESAPLTVSSIQFVFSEKFKEDWIQLYVSLIEQELREYIERK